MKYLFAFILLLIHSFSFSQKPILDQAVLADWPAIRDSKISKNGKYVIYTVFSERSGAHLFLCATDDVLKKKFPGVNDGMFTEDSRRMIFVNQGDSLGVVDLSTDQVEYISHVRSFKMPEKGNGQWMGYELANQELVLLDFFSREERKYFDIEDYSFTAEGRVLLLRGSEKDDSLTGKTLSWVDLPSGKSTVIWRGNFIDNLTFDSSETQVAFLSKIAIKDNDIYSIWIYKTEQDSAHCEVNELTKGMPAGYLVANSELKFSPDGKKLFFGIYAPTPVHNMDLSIAQVDIWHYQDEQLQSEQAPMVFAEKNRSFRAVLNIGERILVRLELSEDHFWSFNELNEGGNDDYLLTESIINTARNKGGVNDQADIYLTNTDNASRICIQKGLVNSEPHFSGGGRYVCWYDRKERAYYTYNIQTSVKKNITAKVSVPLYIESWDVGGLAPPWGVAGCMEQDQAILLYDHYDIWKVDPEGIKAPINCTNGYGRKKKIMLRYVDVGGRNYFEEPAISSTKPLLLCGFNEINKDNGFFTKKMNTPGDPEQLIMCPEVFYSPEIPGSPRIQKAREANVYLLRRMSATKYPNMQITKDFLNFVNISELEPQQKINWLTSELLRWTSFDGHRGEGILYKPENFDPHKKYPIIFYFYERLTERINQFIQPELSIGPMNIPWFVSQGYLVFCPDIHYKVGAPGESTYNCVVSAAKMMSQKPWVDSRHMGIQGHSWGGYEVNYLVTRTGLFAAAASAAGPTDFISLYGIVGITGWDPHNFIENAQVRMGVPLWKNPAGYIKNSPIFGVDKIVTPLLMLNCKKDDLVLWSQGVELFTAMRRLRKPAWMLQYDKGDHQLEDEKDMADYTIRLGQFFDHFLKGKPTPKWMSVGVPARLKGVDSGLELVLPK